MESAHQQLVGDESLLDDLWKARAIDRDTVARLGIGWEPDRHGKSRWLFPIRDDAGQVIFVKKHAEGDGHHKSFWKPKSTKQGDPFFPVCLDGDGTVWVAPGELKGAALVSVGLAAVGITSGEQSGGLSPTALAALTALVGTRSVALPIDNDDQGRTWGSAVQRQLVAARIDARIVDLDLKDEGADVGDWLIEHCVHKHLKPEDARQLLAAAFESAPQVSPAETPTLTPITEAADLAGQHKQRVVLPAVHSVGDFWADKKTWQPVRRTATGIEPLDSVLNGGFMAGGVHLIAGKPGNAKTQLAVQIATNTARRRVPAGFISLEMDGGDISRLVIAQLAEVPRKVMDAGLDAIADSPYAGKVKDAMQRFNGMPLDIVDGDELEAGFNRQDLVELVETGVRERGWRIVFLDHIGEMAALETETALDAIAIEKANMSAMRTLAKRQGIALVAVAPLRKAANWKDAQKGEFSIDDVMGSASLGYAVLTCLGVTAHQAKLTRNAEVLLWLLKSRKGLTPSESIKVPWRPECGRIG